MLIIVISNDDFYDHNNDNRAGQFYGNTLTDMPGQNA